jgi:hypothetical protein
MGTVAKAVIEDCPDELKCMPAAAFGVEFFLSQTASHRNKGPAYPGPLKRVRIALRIQPAVEHRRCDV